MEDNLDINLSSIELIDIDEIQENNFMSNMYDLSIEGDASFVLASGIVSHNSAIAGMGAVRNPRVHAGMPLRGKVLNVNGTAPKKVLENQELLNIMTVLGLQIGEPAHRHKLRYGAVYIAHDADPDGANIGALLVNFFYSYWPELFNPEEKPFISVFMTPFIIAEKGKERRYWYSHNYEEYKPEEWKGWTITRAKGLGSLTNEDWKHSLKEPVLYHLVDDGKLQEALDLIFNDKRSDDRKEWISL